MTIPVSNGQLMVRGGVITCRCCPWWCSSGTLTRVRGATVEVTGLADLTGRIDAGGMNTFDCVVCNFDREDFTIEDGAYAANGTYTGILRNGLGTPVTPAEHADALAAPLTLSTLQQYQAWRWTFGDTAVPVQLSEQTYQSVYGCPGSPAGPAPKNPTTFATSLRVRLGLGSFDGGGFRIQTFTAWAGIPHDPAKTTVTKIYETVGQHAFLEYSSGTWFNSIPFISCAMPALGARREYASRDHTLSYTVVGESPNCPGKMVDYWFTHEQQTRSGVMEQVFDTDQRVF